jgi:hypothetical protein
MEMNIIQKIKELNLPASQYVVVGSSTMDVLGIRPAGDIDIAVTKELHQELRKTGKWKEYEKYNKIFLVDDTFEIIPELFWEGYDTTTKEAISSALIIEGIPFMNLDEVVKFKTAMDREKDIRDIELIKKYKERNSQG